MFSTREIAVLARIQLTKDSKAIGVSFWLIYNPAVLGLFVWTAIDPESSFSFIPVSSQISAASHFIGEFAIANAFLVPFVFYTSVIQKCFEQEAAADSFVVPRILPIDTVVEEEEQTVRAKALTEDAVQLYWARVFSCCSLSLLSFLLPYLSYLCLHLLGVLAEDNLTPILIRGRFPLFITSLTLLTSAMAVVIGVNVRRKSSLLVVAVVVMVVLFAGVVFDAIQGRHDRYFFIKLIDAYGNTLSSPLVLLALSLLMAWVLKGPLRHHNVRGQ